MSKITDQQSQFLYQNLLFSRSTRRDFRWMLFPDFLPPQDLERLKVLAWSEDSRRFFDMLGNNLWPLFVVRMSNSVTVCRFRRSSLKDAGNRPIDCIDGIVVTEDQANNLYHCLPHLLLRNRELLDSWDAIKNEDHDGLVRTAPETFIYHVGANLRAKKSRFTGKSLQSLNNEKAIDFSDVGFKELINQLAQPENRKSGAHYQIAFGIDPARLGMYQGFDLVVPMKI